MKRASIIFLLFWVVSYFQLEAQLPFSFDHPTVIDDKRGLPSKQINALVQDREGFIWIGTSEGLVRFDGHRLELFQHRRNDRRSLPSNRIEALLVDHQNRLWVGTGAGLCYYDPKGNDFVFFTLPTRKKNMTFNGRILSLFQDDQQAVWIGYPKVFARYDPQKDSSAFFQFSAAVPDSSFDITRIESIHSVAQDLHDPDLLWLGSLSGLIQFNKRTLEYVWRPHLMEDKDRQYLANSIKMLCPLADSSVLVGTWAGAYRFYPQEKRFVEIELSDPGGSALTKSSVLSFLQVPDSELIGITYASGFGWYDPGRQLLLPAFNNSLTDGSRYSAHLLDRQKRVWGLSSQGVYLYNPLVNRIRRYDFPFQHQLFPVMPRALVENRRKPTLYLAALACDGIISWNPVKNRWSLIPPPPGFSLENGLQDMIRLANGRIIIVGSHQLFELLEDREQIVPLFPEMDFGSPAFRRAVEGAPNELWIGSRRAGLFRLDLETGNLRVYTDELNKNPNDNRHRWIETLFKDSRSQIWVRTAFEYSVYLPEKDRFYHWDSYGQDSTRNFPLVMAFQEDREGHMWMAGDEFGLAMAAVDDVEKGVLKTIPVADGLPVQNVINLGLDQQGQLWLQHENGITRYDPNSGQSRYFSAGYGVPPDAGEMFTALQDGQMVLGVSGGLALFRPQDLLANEELPVPYLTSFKVFDQTPRHLGSAGQLQEINLSYRQNFFSFEFSALAFNLPEQVRFRYRLLGFDPHWNEAGKRRYAAYTNIPGGDYVFELQAANNEGVWNTRELRVPIHITTPWWKALWFWLPLGLLAILAVAWAIGWRIQQVRRQEQLKSEFDKKLTSMELHALRAQMNPHFIFNCLNSIDYYIIKNETEKASDYLNRFSRLIRLILQNSRAEYVNLKDELEALKLYMEMESLRFDDRFDYVVRVGAGLQLESLEIPPLLLQPYVENAIWHGLAKKTDGKNRLDLTITRDNGSLFCRIEDNGIGREAAQQLKSGTTATHRSMGMFITRDRLQLINRLHQAKGDVQVIDLQDENGQACGTRVDIIIPIR